MAFDFVLDEAITLGASDLKSLRMTKRLMEKYKEVPMDYADATLVRPAEDLSILHIVTFDLNAFETYRFSPKRPFIILL